METIRLLLIIIHYSSLVFFTRATKSSLCRTSCAGIPIQYPFGIDDGCGSPYYRHILVCSDSGSGESLQLRTPSGTYPLQNISYNDPHVLVTDPFMWSCQDGQNYRLAFPFSLDTSTRLKLSPQNEYLFFNCSEDSIIIRPKTIFCEQFPQHCDSSCDNASYLCRHMPECSFIMSGSSCCSYSPKASESLRLMLKYCTTYTSVYWRNLGSPQPYDRVPQYGIRIDFDIPVTRSRRCLQCLDPSKGNGTCGFDTQTESFICLCKDGNSTTHCKDYDVAQNNRRAHVIAVSGISVAGAFGIGAGILYLKKLRAKSPVTCGVQSNENRLF